MLIRFQYVSVDFIEEARWKRGKQVYDKSKVSARTYVLETCPAKSNKPCTINCGGRGTGKCWWRCHGSCNKCQKYQNPEPYLYAQLKTDISTNMIYLSACTCTNIYNHIHGRKPFSKLFRPV